MTTFQGNEFTTHPFDAFKNKLSPKVIGIALLVIIALIGIYSSYYIVDQKEQAVILFFGKYSRTEGPGLHFKLPFGIEKNYNVPTGRNLVEEFGFRTELAGVVSTFQERDFSTESYMLTGDLNIAEVTWSIQYQIRDPRAWLFNTEDQTRTIRDISQAAINLQVGDLAVFDVVTTLRDRIQEKSKVMINQILNRYGLGAEVVEIKLQKTMYPKGPVQNAFEDVNKAIQDRIRLINEGKESYNKAIPRASGEARKIIQEAEGYAVERINQAKGDVARFLAVLGEYKKNPQVTRVRLYYEMLEDVFGPSENIDLIDKQLRNFVPFKSLNSNRKGDEKESKNE